MKIFFRLVLLALLCLFAGCKPKLYSFSPPDKSFTVKMPGVPNDLSRPADKNTRITGGRSFGVQYGQQEYIVTYTDYEFNLTDRLSEKELLDTLTPIVVRDGKVRTKIDIPLSGNSSREFQIIQPDGRIRHTKCVVVGSRFYEIDAFVSDDDKSSQMADRFLNSFELTGS